MLNVEFLMLNEKKSKEAPAFMRGEELPTYQTPKRSSSYPKLPIKKIENGKTKTENRLLAAAFTTQIFVKKLLLKMLFSDII